VSTRLPRFRTSAALIAFIFLHAAAAAAQTPPSEVTTPSLEELLNVEIISTASKFSQEVTHAPASITIITADEIRYYGHRTLADVLRTVRGLYTSYDRNYSYIGVRGFSQPGDYNTRVLLLVDGHRLNDAVYDQAPIGTDFPIDVSLIERVEIIRGPGSSLYGTSAFFGVINVITRNGADRRGLQATVEGGSLGTGRGQVSFGRLFDGSMSLLVSGQGYHSSGSDTLYYPEYDSPDTSNGIVHNADDDRIGGLFAKASIGNVDVAGLYSRRTKGIPTASFGTAFGDGRSETLDARGYVDVQYNGLFGRGWSGTARGGYNHYRYEGNYPYDYGDELGTAIDADGAVSDGLTGELTLNRRFARRNMFTVGTEARHYLRANQWYRAEVWPEDAADPTLDDRRRLTTWATYIQDELALTSKVIVNAGVRVDRYGDLPWEASPRAGVVYLPAPTTALKLLYGRAFRAPNAYEKYYYERPPESDLALAPERITTLEGVWEQYIGSHIRTAVTAFQYDIKGILTLTSNDPQDLDALYFVNADAARAHGIESEVEGRWRGGLTARASQAWVRADDPSSGAVLSNSPGHLTKLNTIVPLGLTGLRLGAQGQYVGPREGVRGNTVKGAFLQDLNLSYTINTGFNVSVGVYNLFDRRYGDPGSEEHLQGAILQDGRTFRARLSLRF
jgi:iron complex outermembrane receptor protein